MGNYNSTTKYTQYSQRNTVYFVYFVKTLCTLWLKSRRLYTRVKEKLKEYEANYPFGFGEPEDVAKAIAFFLSEDSKWITGQNLVMDGGLTLNSK